MLAPHVDRVIATTSGHLGALAPEDVAALARGAGVPADVHEDASEAYAAARVAAGPEGALLVCGTLYLLARLAALEASG